MGMIDPARRGEHHLVGILHTNQPGPWYHAEFLTCRRMETLLAWDSGKPADVVYAARAAGLVLPFPDSAYAPAP
jgi:hypothetical protein